MHPNVHGSTIYNSQDMEVAYVSIERWMGKEDVVYIHNGILVSHKNQWNNAICSNMDGPRDYHTKWSKPDRKRQISYDTTSMWTLKRGYKWTYFQNWNRLTDIENKLMVTKGKEKEG